MIFLKTPPCIRDFDFCWDRREASTATISSTGPFVVRLREGAPHREPHLVNKYWSSTASPHPSPPWVALGHHSQLQPNGAPQEKAVFTMTSHHTRHQKGRMQFFAALPFLRRHNSQLLVNDLRCNTRRRMSMMYGSGAVEATTVF